MHLPLRVFTVQTGNPHDTARIDRGPLYLAETPANRHIPAWSTSWRCLSWRSVPFRLRSITNNNTVREKALEIARLPTVRAMRAVFCDVLLARLTPLPSPQFGSIDEGSSKPPQTPS
jgi:hypothetical protein